MDRIARRHWETQMVSRACLRSSDLSSRAWCPGLKGGDRRAAGEEGGSLWSAHRTSRGRGRGG